MSDPVPGPILIALVTADGYADLDEDLPLIAAALAELGVASDVVAWDDPAAAWPSYDGVLLRSAWDYVPRRDRFVRWACEVGDALLNPAPMVAWNTDKTYLRELAAAGVPTVPTEFVPPGAVATVPEHWAEIVVKPTISASAADTSRFPDLAAAEPLLAAIHGSGRTAMVQPYLAGIERAGETAVMILGGAYSHAARKEAVLAEVVSGTGEHPAMSPAAADPDQLAAARAALAALPAGLGTPVYARIDLVPGVDGAPLLMELELTEPSLFLPLAADPPAAAGQLARAVLAELTRRGRLPGAGLSS